MIEMVEFVDYTGKKPKTFGRIYFSPEQGLTCDDEVLAAGLAEEGVMIPPGVLLYPRDGRRFFDGLKYAGSSYMLVRAPVEMPEQKGAAFQSNT